jgi:hypothetical protein
LSGKSLQVHIRPLDFALYRDSLFIVPDYTGMFRYHIVNKAGNIIKSHQSIPSHDNKKNALNILLAQAWRSFIDYNPHNGILAMATQLGEVVEIYDVNQDTIIHIFKGEAGEPEFLCREGYAIPNGIMGYSDIHVGDKYIYAIFWGRTFKDIRRNVNTPEGGKCIHIFDLQGNPISKINLDRYITGFDVDEAHHKIVALDVNSNQPLIEFSIPNL